MDEKAIAGFMAAFASAAEPVEVHFLRRPQLADPDDEIVLEAAVNGRSKMGYRYRAVDKQGNTVESLFQTTRGIAAAMAFFRKAVVTCAPRDVAKSIRAHPGDAGIDLLRGSVRPSNRPRLVSLDALDKSIAHMSK
jgi:hypothetical protein